ncbi:MAG: leucine-rich repeat domain-containing protein, partial [Clostridia bacterium]|nr:leucine-rich repeat domain-containing protein [Clostridia bacterium]
MEVEQSTPERYDIPGVYYASPQEVTGAVDAPLTAKAGSIYVGKNSTFTFSQGAVRSHAATYGGAIYVANGGTFTMTGGVIAYNKAQWGGAIYVEAGGTCYLNGGTITGNASEEATAVYVEDGATLVVDGCNIVNNYTQLYGNYIDFYVDGELNRSVSLGQNGTTFNLADAPLTYEQCPGYFTDENCSSGVEDGASLAPVVQSAVATGEPGEIYNLYTKSATLNKLTFTSVTGGYSVAKNGAPIGEVVIPRQYSGENVTSIGGSAFSSCSGLTSVTIGSGVTSIGSKAFYGCSGLTSVVIPDSVTSIGDGAFAGCSGLTSVTIGDSVASIGDAAFDGCTGLIEVYNLSNLNITAGSYDNGWVAYNAVVVITDENDKGIITTSNNVRYYVNRNVLPNVKVALDIVDNTATSLVIDDDCTAIRSAFASNTTLTDVTIGSNVTSIGDGAFAGCSGLTSVTIGDSVASIGDGAFSGCTGLIEVY